MSSFNRGGSLIYCPPDCPERKPGCHDHCERYKTQKAANEKRKIEVYGDPLITQYFREKVSERADKAAKNRKRHELFRKDKI